MRHRLRRRKERSHESELQSQRTFLVSLLKNVKRHPILDAAGHVDMLCLGVDDAFFSSELAANGEQRRVADHVLQLFASSGCVANRDVRPRGLDAVDECCDLVLHKK